MGAARTGLCHKAQPSRSFLTPPNRSLRIQNPGSNGFESHPPFGGRATAKSRKTGRGVPANPGPIGGLKNKLDADGRGSGRMGPRGSSRTAYGQRHGADAAGKRTGWSCRKGRLTRGALSRGLCTMTLEREALVRDEPRGPILPASLGRFLDRCWSRKSAYFQRSSALLCLFLSVSGGPQSHRAIRPGPRLCRDPACRVATSGPECRSSLAGPWHAATRKARQRCGGPRRRGVLGLERRQ